MSSHPDVAAYLLGVLNDEEQVSFEEHLRTCPQCTAELDSMLGVADPLADVDADALVAAEQAGGTLRRMIAEVERERFHAHLHRIRLAVAAASVAAAFAVLLIEPFGRTPAVIAACVLVALAPLIAFGHLIIDFLSDIGSRVLRRLHRPAPTQSPVAEARSLADEWARTVRTLDKLSAQAIASAHPLLALEIDKVLRLLGGPPAGTDRFVARLADRPWEQEGVRATLDQVGLARLRRRVRRGNVAYRFNMPLTRDASLNFAVTRTADQLDRLGQAILSQLPHGDSRDGSHV